MQIDAIKIGAHTVECNLYTGDRCVKILMATNEYENLKRDGFFIRQKDERDSAGVLNATHDYELAIAVTGS